MREARRAHTDDFPSAIAAMIFFAFSLVSANKSIQRSKK
jgi:hypothetical protein